jgi:hypothetical protein
MKSKISVGSYNLLANFFSDKHEKYHFGNKRLQPLKTALSKMQVNCVQEMTPEMCSLLFGVHQIYMLHQHPTECCEKVGLLPGDMFKIISESEAMNLRTNTTFNFMLENIGTPWIGFIIHSDAG